MKTFEITILHWVNYFDEEMEKDFNVHKIQAVNFKQAFKIAKDLYKYPIELIYKNKIYKV